MTQSPIEVARDAAVVVRGADGVLLGHGLLATLPQSGTVVLTCHHVIARTAPDAIRVTAGANGDRAELPIAFDEAASRPRRDVAVLRPQGRTPLGIPLLHVPSPRALSGRLDAIGLVPGETSAVLHAQLGPGGAVRVAVDHLPRRYTLPDSFNLHQPSDTQAGISGAPVVVEDGVVGLIHFARSETPAKGRAAYVNPLTAWCDGLPDLADVIEPFVSRALRDVAYVHSGRTLRPDRAGLVDGYDPGVYLPRDIDDLARRAFTERSALCLAGRSGAGATRLACRLLEERPEALVVMPTPSVPPGDLGNVSCLRGREVVLLFDGIQSDFNMWDTFGWYQRFVRIAGRLVVLATARIELERDWDELEKGQRGLFEILRAQPVFLSTPKGRDLSREEGRRLAESLGRSFDDGRFDGTPGSVLREQDAKPNGDRPALPDGERAGIAIEDAAPSGIPGNLPLLSSTFVGREDELARVGQLLAGNRLVTLFGPEGHGKTRLAGRAARLEAERFPAGAWWIDLVAVVEPAFVPHAVGSVLGVGELAWRPRDVAIAERLGPGPALLVLNGFEHVPGGAADLAARLLQLAPELTILATGPAPLGVTGEIAYAVPPLAGAERLFYDRSLHAHGEERAGVEALCRELDNNPLAIEIAAATARGAGVAGVVEDLRRRASGRGHAGGDAAKAIGDAVGLTLDGLEQADVDVFAALSVFAGWWTLPAAAAVAGDRVEADRVPEIVRRLVDRALVLIDDRHGRHERFRVLEPVRLDGEQRLAAAGRRREAHERHARYFLRLARAAGTHLRGAADREWLDDLLHDRDNLRAALTWALESGEHALAVDLGAALWPVWQRTAPFANGRRWLERVVDGVPGDQPSLWPGLAEVHNGAGNLAYDAGAYEAAERHYARSLDLRRATGAEDLEAGSLNNLGLIARRRGDCEGAAALFARAIELSRRHARPHWVALALNNLANTLREDLDPDLDAAARAEQLAQVALLHRESLALFSRLGSESGAATARCDLCWAVADLGDEPDARLHGLASLAARRAIGDRHGEAQSLNALGRLDRLGGDLEPAAERHRQAIAILEELGDRLRIAESLEGYGLALGRDARAAEALAAAAAIRAEIGAPLPPSGRAEVDAAAAHAGTPPAPRPLGELLRSIVGA